LTILSLNQQVDGTAIIIGNYSIDFATTKRLLVMAVKVTNLAVIVLSRSYQWNQTFGFGKTICW